MLIRPNIVPNIKDNIQSDLDRNLLGTYSSGAEITTTKVGTFSMTLRGYAGTLKVNWRDGSPPEIVTLLGTSTNVVVNHTYVLAGVKKIVIAGDLLNITYLSANSQNLIGDVSNIVKNLNSLIAVSLNYNNLTGTVNYFNHLLNLITLSIRGNTGLGGDLAGLAPLVNLVSVTLIDNVCTFTSASFPPWTGYTFYFRSCLSTATEVDNILIAFAAGGMHDCTLYLDGTNPARTSASDVAVATLALNNVILHVNT